MNITAILVALIPAIASVIIAAIQVKAANSNTVDNEQLSDNKSKNKDLFARVLALLSIGLTLSILVYWVVNPKPPLYFGDLVEQPIDTWFEVNSDGFVQVRVGGDDGSKAHVWCSRNKEKTGNRILDISGYTSDFIIGPAKRLLFG